MGPGDILGVKGTPEIEIKEKVSNIISKTLLAQAGYIEEEIRNCGTCKYFKREIVANSNICSLLSYTIIHQTMPTQFIKVSPKEGRCKFYTREVKE